MNTKVISRQFVKETSVFKAWHKETLSKQKESIEEDCKLWKLPKFIKNKGEEGEIDACKALISKHSEFLKECFIDLISSSSYPAISTLSIISFANKA